MDEYMKMEEKINSYLKKYRMVSYSPEALAIERTRWDVEGELVEVVIQHDTFDRKDFEIDQNKLTFEELLELFYNKLSDSAKKEQEEAHQRARKKLRFTAGDRRHYSMGENLFFQHVEREKREVMGQLIQKHLELKNFRNLEKKSARTTFEMDVKFNDKTEVIFVEYWKTRSFCKIYKGPSRLFFSEEIFEQLVGGIRSSESFYKNFHLNETVHELVNETFNRLIGEKIEKSECYRMKKLNEPEFEL